MYLNDWVKSLSSLSDEDKRCLLDATLLDWLDTKCVALSARAAAQGWGAPAAAAVLALSSAPMAHGGSLVRCGTRALLLRARRVFFPLEDGSKVSFLKVFQYVHLNPELKALVDSGRVVEEVGENVSAAVRGASAGRPALDAGSASPAAGEGRPFCTSRLQGCHQ